MDCGVVGEVREGYGVDGAGAGGFEGCGEGFRGCLFGCGGGGGFAGEGVRLFGEDVLQRRRGLVGKLEEGREGGGLRDFGRDIFVDR